MMIKDDAGIVYTWSEIDNLLVDVVAKNKGLLNIRKIVSLSRGGLCPAAILAHKINVTDVESVQICAVTRRFDRVNGRFNAEDVLFVDDIVDTGQTMRNIADKYPLAKRLVVVAKSRTSDLVNYFGVRIWVDDWVVFPWEVDTLEVDNG